MIEESDNAQQDTVSDIPYHPVVLGLIPDLSVGIWNFSKNNTGWYLLFYEQLLMKKTNSLNMRVGFLYDFCLRKVDEYSVYTQALKPFLGINVRTLSVLSAARAMIYLISYRRNLNIFEYSPQNIKKQITGSEDLIKRQLQRFYTAFSPGLPPP